MSLRTLSEKLEAFRCERPSEWLMDEYIRDATELEQENTALKQQVLERDARIKALEDALRTVDGINYDAARVRLSAVVDKALSTTTPSEALAAHDKALLDEAFEIIGYWLPCKDATGSVILDYQDDGYEPLYRRKEMEWKPMNRNVTLRARPA